MYPPYSPWNLLFTILFLVGILGGGYFLMNVLFYWELTLKKKILGVCIAVFIVITFLLNLWMWNGNPYG